MLLDQPSSAFTAAELFSNCPAGWETAVLASVSQRLPGHVPKPGDATAALLRGPAPPVYVSASRTAAPSGPSSSAPPASAQASSWSASSGPTTVAGAGSLSP
jgi:hypothetical protein